MRAIIPIPKTAAATMATQTQQPPNGENPERLSSRNHFVHALLSSLQISSSILHFVWYARYMNSPNLMYIAKFHWLELLFERDADLRRASEAK